MGILDGKVALVTGAARAQGRAHAMTMARNGADVVLLDIGHDVDGVRYQLGSAEELEQTAHDVEQLGRRVVARQADVRSQDDLDAVVAAGVAEFGPIDIAIANAGVFDFGPSWELTEQRVVQRHRDQPRGVWRTAKAVIPVMIANGGGAIVMISSTNGLEPWPDTATTSRPSTASSA